MPDSDTRVLLRLGPVKGIDTRSASVYTEPGDCPVLSNVDTHRIGGAMCNFLGRTQLTTLSFLGAEPIVSLTRYDVSQIQTFYIAQGTAPAALTVAYEPGNHSQQYIPGLLAFTEAVQSNGALFFNSGQQVFWGLR